MSNTPQPSNITPDHFGLIHAASRQLIYVAFVFLLVRLISVFFVAFAMQQTWALEFYKGWLPYVQFRSDPIEFSRMNLYALVLSITIMLLLFLYHAIIADSLKFNGYPRTVAWFLAVWMGALEFVFTYALNLTPEHVITSRELALTASYMGLATFVFLVVSKKRYPLYKEYVNGLTAELDQKDKPST